MIYHFLKKNGNINSQIKNFEILKIFEKFFNSFLIFAQMEEFMIYKNLQSLLLSMKDDNSIDIVKNFIDENNLFSESLNLSTLRLIGSVVYSRPEILSKAVKLLNKFDSISIKSDIINDNLSDFEVIYRYSSILTLLFLIDNGNFDESLIYGLRVYTYGGYHDTFYSK